MYEEHPSFPQPENVNAKIWRYMDFTKFIDMLRTGGLFFSRADKLGDPFEGSWPSINARGWRDHASRMEALALADNREFDQSAEVLSRAFRSFTKYKGVNCWHMSEVESDAMWKLYLKSNEGIAIQTRYELLRDSFSSVEETIFLGKIRYLNYETEHFRSDNLCNPYMHKRLGFQHEREIRALLIRYPESHRDPVGSGVLIPVKLSKLVEAVYVAPFCGDWVKDNVEEVIKRFGYKFHVVRSSFEKPPDF